MTTGEPENQRTTIARIVNAVTFTCQVNQSQHGLAMSMSKIKKKIRSRVSKLQGEQIWAQLTLCGTTKAEKDISLRFCCILFGTRFQCILSETKFHCTFSRTRLCCIPTPMEAILSWKPESVTDMTFYDRGRFSRKNVELYLVKGLSFNEQWAWRLKSCPGQPKQVCSISKSSSLF